MSIGRALPLMKGMNARPVPPSQDRGKQYRDGRQRRAGPSSAILLARRVDWCFPVSAGGTNGAFPIRLPWKGPKSAFSFGTELVALSRKREDRNGAAWGCDNTDKRNALY